MEEFFGGLSKKDQKKYQKLSKEFSELGDIDKMKKYIPCLILLREKGWLELSKKEKRRANNISRWMIYIHDKLLIFRFYVFF